VMKLKPQTPILNLEIASTRKYIDRRSKKGVLVSIDDVGVEK